MKLYSIVIICLILALVTGCAEITPTSSSQPTKTTKPSGTYVGTMQSIYGSLELTITFTRDTIEYYDRINGKRIFKYTISEDGSTLTTEDVMGTVATQDFKYDPEYECVIIYSTDSSHIPIQYYRK